MKQNMDGMARWMVTWLFAALVIAPIARAQDAAKPAAFKNEEIEQLVAPIALYPDALVAQILMASTYPLEIVSAARWSKANPKVTGKTLEDAMQKQTWDPSVKSLAAFPGVLAMMNDKLDMTQKLGDAFLGQQKDVMDAVQRLRAKAYAAGNLKSGKEQKVTTEQQGTTTIIVIEPAQPQVVYVPTYNPMVVYGPWPYPAYPPYYYYPPGYAAGTTFFVFTAGIIVGSAMWGRCNWHGNSVYVSVNHYNSFNRTNINNGNWQHQPEHRKGVQYRDTASQQKYGGGQRQGAESRDAYRGRDGQSGQDARRGADPSKGGGASDRAGGREAGAGGREAGAGGREAGTADRAGGAGDRTGGGARDPGGTQRAGGREAGAFDGVGQGGQTRDFSSRGASSHAGGGGGARAGGGGGRGGGGRR